MDNMHDEHISQTKSARFKAIAEGKIHYDGAACRTCGSTLRYCSNACCVSCLKGHAKIYQQRIREARG